MAVNKEIWLPSIQENLFKGFELLRQVASDDSAYVQNYKVHVPNAAAAPSVSRANSTYPVAVTERSDTDVDYSLTNFEIGPVRLGWAEKLQLSYDKVQSITADFIGNLNENMKNYILSQWYDYSASTLVSTTGSSTSTNWLGGSAAGSLKHMLGADVRSAAQILDRQKFPTNDRYLLVDYAQFWQLLGDLAYNAARVEVINGLSATMDAIYGFKVIQLPYVAAVDVNTGTASMIEPATADGSYTFTTNNRPVALAFHKSAVSYAWTPVEMFTAEQDPGHFGDVMSASVYGGGKYRRTSANGVVAIRSTSA